MIEAKDMPQSGACLTHLAWHPLPILTDGEGDGGRGLSNDYAPDGSPVGFYALLPPMGEAEMVREVVPPGSALLELGCGAGRVTRALAALGYNVVAVDQSAAMLAHVRVAETVCADIETLDLGQTFPAVLLMSQLVNTPEDTRRASFLRACARHAAPGGDVIVQRLDPGWAMTAVEGEQVWGEFRIALREVRRTGDLLSAVSSYETGGHVWRQPWTMRVLDDLTLEVELARAGLRLRRWLGHNRTWAVATRAGSADGAAGGPGAG